MDRKRIDMPNKSVNSEYVSKEKITRLFGNAWNCDEYHVDLVTHYESANVDRLLEPFRKLKLNFMTNFCMTISEEFYKSSRLQKSFSSNF